MCIDDGWATEKEGDGRSLHKAKDSSLMDREKDRKRADAKKMGVIMSEENEPTKRLETRCRV